MFRTPRISYPSVRLKPYSKTPINTLLPKLSDAAVVTSWLRSKTSCTRKECGSCLVVPARRPTRAHGKPRRPCLN